MAATQTTQPLEGGGRLGPPPVGRELAALAAILVVYLAVTVAGVLHGAPLGHDEAVYSSQARSFATGAPSVGFWGDYRAPGLPWVLQLAWLGPATEPYLRMVVAVWGAAGLALTWLLGRSLFGRWEGLAAAAGLGVTPIWVSAATHVWPDVPGATVGLAALAVLVAATHDDRISWWILLAAPLTLAATVVRYGAPGPILVGALAIAWWRRRAIRSGIGKVVALAVATGGPLAIVLLTNLTFSTATPPLRAAMQLRPNRGGTIADGWVVLGNELPELLAQPAIVFLFTGLALAVAMRVEDRERRSRLLMVLATSLGTLVVLATALSSELRYFAPLLPWMWLGAGVGIVALVRNLDRGAVLALGAVSLVALGFGVNGSTGEDADLLTDRFQRLREAARDRQWPPGCHIATSYGPQVGWYTGCTTVEFVLGGVDDPVPTSPPATHILVLQGGKRQPVNLRPWLDASTELAFTYGDRSLGSLQFIEVYVPVPTG